MLTEDTRPDPNPASPTSRVLVVGRDPVVGHALVLLLRSSSYDVGFLLDTSLSEPGVLEGARLLLLAPSLGAERRKTVLSLIEFGAATKSVPILELAADGSASRARERHLVMPWPCRMEDLQRQIEMMLLTGSGIEG